MISHDHKCIFIHIPKCGGTSIEKALGHFDNYSGRGRQDHRCLRMLEPITKAHLKPCNIKELFKRLYFRFKSEENIRNKHTVSSRQYAKYFKFTIIRNPWARAYSWYKNVLSDELYRFKYGISGHVSLHEFLSENIGKEGLRPQTYWLINSNGNILLDFIGRLEDLENDFMQVCEHLDIEPIKLTHELKSNKTDYRSMYDRNSIDLIASTFKKEIQLFNYTFKK